MRTSPVEREPAGDPSTTPFVDGPLREAVMLLWKARRLADDAGCDSWDFAIELGELRRLGASICEVRWLLARGMAAQAGELPLGTTGRRRFSAPSTWAVRPNSCFVITETGLAWANRSTDKAALAKVASATTAGQERSQLDLLPRAETSGRLRPFYNNFRSELVFGSEVIKRFRTPALNQQAVLSAFQSLAWPDRINDPLTPSDELCPRRRLSETIRALNRRQMRRVVRFSGDGSGRGILWERIG